MLLTILSSNYDIILTTAMLGKDMDTVIVTLAMTGKMQQQEHVLGRRFVSHFSYSYFTEST